MSSLGLIGGFASPTILVWVKTTTGCLNNGLYVIAGLLTIGALMTLRFRNKAKARVRA